MTIAMPLSAGDCETKASKDIQMVPRPFSPVCRPPFRRGAIVERPAYAFLAGRSMHLPFPNQATSSTTIIATRPSRALIQATPAGFGC
ncbi:hypothetical protein [Sphingomonas sp. NFX23]|uniref:hypothetical protein n=1 Tax=Sphingomonas sp. NFX23 TaxID=2819532 RepID=UPI003CF87F9B